MFNIFCTSGRDPVLNCQSNTNGIINHNTAIYSSFLPHNINIILLYSTFKLKDLVIFAHCLNYFTDNNICIGCIYNKLLRNIWVD